MYRHFGDPVPFDRILARIPSLEEGGTLGVMLANDALARGYRVTLVTWNLQVFDPTWLGPKAHLLRDRLQRRADAKRDPKLRLAVTARWSGSRCA